MKTMQNHFGIDIVKVFNMPVKIPVVCKQIETWLNFQPNPLKVFLYLIKSKSMTGRAERKRIL